MAIITIDPKFIDGFRAIKTLTALNLLDASSVKSKKKSIWNDIRKQYKLDPAVKYKVELDDPKGELRFKSNDQPVTIPDRPDTPVKVSLWVETDGAVQADVAHAADAGDLFVPPGAAVFDLVIPGTLQATDAATLAATAIANAQQ